MIDWTRVKELRADIGEEDFDEVVGLFLEEVDAAVTSLREGAPDGSLEESLHFLKGSAMGLGFEDFSSHCQIGETSCAKGQEDDVDLAAILQSYDASRAEFLQDLPTVLSN
ncbi:MAG: Hpt domain-containing protein [Pseudomonadota bacterium]